MDSDEHQFRLKEKKLPQKLEDTKHLKQISLVFLRALVTSC